jgi:hypothetical protein
MISTDRPIARMLGWTAGGSAGCAVVTRVTGGQRSAYYRIV